MLQDWSLPSYHNLLIPGWQTSPQAAQYGQSDVAVGVAIAARIGVRFVGGHLGSAGHHRGGAIGGGAGAGGLAHRDGYRRVLIVALHHLDGAGVAGGDAAHLSVLRLVQLPPDLPIDGLRVLRISFRAENGSSLQQFQEIQAIFSISFSTKGSIKEKTI